MAEVQQSSDATFRLYDWNRPGSDGKPRQLHIRESLEAIDWNAGPVHPVVRRPLEGLPEGVRGGKLVRCRYFNLDRYEAAGPFDVPAGRLSIWMVVSGAIELRAEGYRRIFWQGETVLVPASCRGASWHAEDIKPAGHMTLLGITLP